MSNIKKLLYSYILIIILSVNLVKADEYRLSKTPIYTNCKTKTSEEHITSRVKTRKYRLTKIAIDPGHGGRDPGGCSKDKKYKEKNICLNVAKKLKRRIISEFNKKIEVIMTRETDNFVSLGDRSRIVNNNKADLLISIHCNTCSDSRAKGCEIYVMGSKARWPSFKIVADLKQANIRTMERNTVAMENQVIFLDEEDKKDYIKNLRAPHSKILTNIFADANLRNSATFAGFVKKNMVACTPPKYPIKVLEDGFILLWKVIAPSIYLELGFLTNPYDLRKLTNDEGQNQIVNAIIKAIKEYEKRL